MDRSQRFWDKTARRYAADPVSDEATYQRKLAETQSVLRPEMHILEFGCGTGTTAIHHSAHVQRIDAVDISANMLEIAGERAVSAGVDNITFTRGTLTEFNAEAGGLDAVLGLNVIHLLPDRRAVIAEAARILRPGGLLVTSTVCLGDSYLRFVKFLVPLGKRLALMPDLFILTEAQLSAEISDAGFAIESQWKHGKNDIVVFMVARKVSG